MTTKELIAEINDLLVDQRIKIARQILQGLNGPKPEIENVWAKKTQKQRDDFAQGKTETIPGD